MIGKTNAGSGSGGSSRDAVLRITCDAGSTVVVSKSGVSLTPTLWTQAGDQTRATALVFISPALFDAVNPWTVTINPPYAPQQILTVTVSEAREYELDGGQVVYFIRNGQFTSLATRAVAGYASPSITEAAEGYVEFTVPGAYSTSCCLYFSAVPRSHYNYLVLEGRWKGQTGDYTPGFGVVSSLSTSGSNRSVLDPCYKLLDNSTGSYATESAVRALALGSASGDLMIGVQISGSGYYSYAGGMQIHNLYLSVNAPT